MIRMIDIHYHYYLLHFTYDGPRGRGPLGGIDDPECSDACMDADLYVENVLERIEEIANIRFLHAYSWPDGSLYKYAKSAVALDMSTFEMIWDEVTKGDEHMAGRVRAMTESSPNADPYKYNANTLEQYFKRHEKRD